MAMPAGGLDRALLKVLETGDRALAVEAVHERFRNREAAVSPPASRIAGPAGVLASSAWMRYTFADLRLSVTDGVTSDTQVWLRVRMQGRHTGAFVLFQGEKVGKVLPPTGREIDFEQIHVLDVRDGKVSHHEAVRDDMTMLGQLGVFPPSPAVGPRMLAWRVTGHAARAAAEVSAKAAQASCDAAVMPYG